MQTTTAEIGDRIFRFSTFIAQAGPNGLTFNQFLVDGDAPLLFHTGMRALFPLVREALGKVIPVEKLRWISFGHIEADECGAVNQWLAAAPASQVVHSQLACDLSVRDLVDRPPHALGDGEVLDLGNRRVRMLMTPHVPHNWEAITLFEEETRTLLCGDVTTHDGPRPALATADVVQPVLDAERTFHAWSLTPSTAATLHRLADLEPACLASMHGSSVQGGCGKVLREIAAGLATIANARG